MLFRSGEVADREQLERGFSRLKPEQRAVLVLHFYSGFSASEIAEALGIPEGTARSRLHYATEAMRAALEAAGCAFELKVYEGVRHGFSVTGHPVYDRTASEEHWQVLARFFPKVLKA